MPPAISRGERELEAPPTSVRATSGKALGPAQKIVGILTDWVYIVLLNPGLE
jgi:hypothetical protein